MAEFGVCYVFSGCGLYSDITVGRGEVSGDIGCGVALLLYQ